MGAGNGAKLDNDLVAKVLQKPSKERGHYATSAKSVLPRGDMFQKAFLAEWGQGEDDPSRAGEQLRDVDTTIG